MTLKINLLGKTQPKIIEPNTNSQFLGIHSENLHLVNKNQSGQVANFKPSFFVKNSFIYEYQKLHDTISMRDIINFISSLQKDAQKFGVKPFQQDLINLFAGSRIDPKSFVNNLDTKFYAIFG